MSSEQKDALMELCKVHVHAQVIIFYVPRFLEAWWHNIGYLANRLLVNWVYSEIAECSLGRAGQAKSGLVRRECPVSRSLRSRSHEALTPTRFAHRIFSDLAGSLFTSKILVH